MRERKSAMKAFVKENLPGIAFCFCISLPSYFLGKAFPLIGGPVFAILLGMVIAVFLKDKGVFSAGISFTGKKVLQYAVVLLGFGLNLTTIAKTGSLSLPIIVATIAVSLVLSFVLCKVMKIPARVSTLIGVGSSICGGSAIAATAPVIDANDEEIAQAISVIFLFNILAALIFPSLGSFLQMTNDGFGIFAGTAVNDTSSVTAAASAWDGMHPGANTLDTATIVKLTRTLAIIPITFCLALYRMKKEKTDAKKSFSLKKVFPMFILYFILASAVTTLVSVFFAENAAVMGAADAAFGFLKSCSKFFIIMAMAAIGLNSDIVKLVKKGGKPIFMGFCCWAAISLVSILMQHAIGVW